MEKLSILGRSEFRDSAHTFLQKLSERVQKGGFWFLLILLAGVLIGSVGSFKYHQSQLRDSVKLGGMLVDGKAYTINERKPF